MHAVRLEWAISEAEPAVYRKVKMAYYSDRITTEKMTMLVRDSRDLHHLIRFVDSVGQLFR